jgi:glycosyltransferase involved in cell wall biosynthesis
MDDGGIRARHFLEGRRWMLRFARENDYAKMFGMAMERLHSALPPEAYNLPDVRQAYDEINRFVESLKIKTVAFVFDDLSQGGIQRVMSYLIPLFVMNWYRVVLFTTNGRERDVYSLNVPVERIVIGVDKIPESRSCRLREALSRHRVEFVIFQEYYSPWLRSDMATAKSCGVHCIVHHHNMFSNFFLRQKMMIDKLVQYRLFEEASALIVLSHSDEYYFRAMGCNAHYFPNPVEDVPEGFHRSPEGKTVLWMARYTAVKRPLDALKIFDRVLQRHPDARLKMLGDITGMGETKVLVAQIRDYLSKRPDLSAAVSLEGFQSDVWKYLSGASALLTTAKFEGFLCTLSEASAAGVPAVGYELPYLELAQDNPGFVQTPQGNVAAAADAVCRLFEDEAYAKRASVSARAAFERIRDFDQMHAYKRLFADIEKGARVTCPDGMPEKILRMTVLHALTGLAEQAQWLVGAQEDKLAAQGKQAGRLRVKLEQTKKQLAELKASEAYRVGIFVTWPARKAWGGVKCLRENGLKYTVKHAAGKVLRTFGSKCRW